MTRAELKETLRNIMNEESEYQVFFKNALEKAGKSITDMSDEEKKEFFNKIDAAWDGKGEKNEELVGNQKKLDVDGDGEIEASDLAALRAGETKEESVTESTINESPSSEEIRIAMLAVSKQKKYRRVTTSAAVNDLMNSLEVIARDIKNGKIKDESVNESSKDYDYADELQKETEKVLKGKNIKGWKLYVDSRSGTFEFEKKGIDLLIYATPMWDGNPNLPFNVMDGEGDNVNMIEKSIGNLLSFKPSYDLKKDVLNYISVITKTLPKVEALYNKIKSESVNEGKKRFNTNYGVGKSKYVVNYHDGVKKHKDGSDFFDVQIFKNQKDLEAFKKALLQKGFVAESVNEASYVSGYTVKAKTPYEFVNGAYAVLSAYLRDEELGPKGKRELQNILKSLEYMRKYFFFNLSESVNEDTKKRFDVDFYKVLGDRQTSQEEIIRGDKFSDVISQATKVAKSKGMNYVEFYYKDTFIGSIDKKSNYTFKKGRNSEKSPLSVNEAAGKEAMGIAAFTGTRGDAVQKFIDDNKLDAKKLFNYVKGGKLTDRLNFVTAVVGTPGNPVQKRMIKMFGESVNEEIAVGKMVKVVDNPHWEAALGKKGPFKRKVKMIDGDNVFFTDGSNSSMKYVKESVESVNEGRAFINAARKAKQEGKTEFEFNGKKYPVTLKEGTLNEMNPQLNKGVKSLLDKELKDLRKGGSNHLFAVMNVLMGALTDANFHSESKKVPAIFGSKAKYEGDPMAQKDMESLYQSIGERIATMAKWDGEDIAKAVGFYVSMTIGRPLGQKIENLV